MNFSLLKINTDNDWLQQTKQLFIAYQQELNVDLCFQNFEAEMENPLKKYGAPKGCLIIATQNETAIGCVALQQLENNNCEMKRLYVIPTMRKHKVGVALVRQIILEAKQLGYTTIKLDTLSRLQSAINIYEKFGFKHSEAYYQNPLQNVVYMQLTL